MKKIYISGKITDLPMNDVVAKFSKAKESLERQGYEVVSPLETGVPRNASWSVHVAVDIVLLIGCDAIYMLSDWESSRGATLEMKIATAVGKEIIYQNAPVFMGLKKAICEAMNIDFYEIAGKRRDSLLVFARIIFSYYCIKEKITTIKIASWINRNHATVIYYLRKYPDYYQFTPEFRAFADKVEELYKGD
jgi:hypothetical protein